jgi:hypothetical protein
VIGSGHFGLIREFDSSVYAVDCGNQLALVDAGAGVAPEAPVENRRKDGLDPGRSKILLLSCCGASLDEYSDKVIDCVGRIAPPPNLL